MAIATSYWFCLSLCIFPLLSRVTQLNITTWKHNKYFVYDQTHMCTQVPKWHHRVMSGVHVHTPAYNCTTISYQSWLHMHATVHIIHHIHISVYMYVCVCVCVCVCVRTYIVVVSVSQVGACVLLKNTAISVNH